MKEATRTASNDLSSAWPFAIWSNDLGEALMAFAFFCIAVLLLYFLYRRPDAQYRRIFYAFGFFILGCGTVSVLAIVSSSNTLLLGIAKIGTGIAAMATVVQLLLNFKDILRIPSITSLKEKQEELLREVEQHQHALASLQQRETSVNFMLRRSPVGTATFSRDGNFTQVNEALANLLGRSADELIGLSFQAITHPDDVEHDIEIGRRFLNREFFEHQWEKRFLHADGREINVLMVVALIPGEHSELDIWIAQILDISERVEQERLLRERGMALELIVDERTRALRESNENLEYFIYAITHDLRQPLKNMEALVDVLTLEQPSPEEEQTIKQLLHENAARMDELITDLLVFSRTSQEELHLETVDANPILASVLERYRAQYQDHEIALEVATLPPAKGDPAAIQLIWDNLIGNAFKYSSHEEKIEIQITAEVQPDAIVYCVRDNGIGFDEQYKHKLFGLFQRLHPQSSFPGTGIGLAVVHRMLLRQGGAIWANSRPGEGATFCFRLPVANVPVLKTG